MTTPNPIAETSTLQAPYWNGSQWVRDVSSPEEILAGDTLLVMVGGGNKVDSYPGGVWQQLNYQTGQEAQGFVMAATFTTDQGFATWTLAFDGTDKSVVSVVHLRVPDVRFMVDDFSREGTVGVTRPAESLPLTGAGKDDTEYYLAFVRNSGGAYPTTSDADTVYALSNGNEGAALFRRQPTTDATTTLDLPSCTGHYAVAVGLYVPSWSDWRDDSVEFWGYGQSHPTLRPAVDPAVTVFDTESVKQSSYDNGHTTAQASADAAWAGTGTGGQTLAAGWQRSSFEADDTTPIGGPDRFPVSWATDFISIARGAGDVPGREGTLPDTVYDYTTDTFVDPDVIAVEWEPDPQPIDQRLHLSTSTNYSSSTFDPDVDAVTIYGITEAADAPLGPTTFQTRSAIRSGEALWTSTAGTDETYYTGPLLGGDPVAPLRLRLTALDHVTVTGTVPPYSAPAQINTSSLFSVDLQQLYRPRYRLMSRHGVVVTTSVTRLWPRDDALGLGTANRLVPTPRAGRIIGRQP